MKVTNEKIESRQAYLTVELEPAEVEGALEKAYHKLVRSVNIPGYRKGKAPRLVLERHIGKERLLEEALNNLIPQTYEDAVKEQKLEAIAQPQIEITQTDPVVFKAVVPLRPTIDLGDYQNIKATPEPVEVSEEDTDSVIKQLQHQHATWEPVERPVELGDLVVMDIESSVDGLPLVNRLGTQFQVIPEAVFPAPGFSQELQGMKAGEEREFQLEFPPDYPRKELAGKPTSFKVKVNEIKQERLPELNDEFAQSINKEYKTMDELREQVTTNLKLQATEKAKRNLEEKVLQAAVDCGNVEFPPVLLEMEIDRLLNQEIQRLQMSGADLEKYLKGINKTAAELREEIRPVAEKSVTRSLILGKITDEEKTEATDSEVDAEIESILNDAPTNKENLTQLFTNPGAREAVRRSLVRRKTVQRLVEIAAGSGKEAPVHESSEDGIEPSDDKS